MAADATNKYPPDRSDGPSVAPAAPITKNPSLMTAAVFDRELIERYDGRGPRYTSYPTAVQLQSGFGEAEYREQVRLAHAEAGAAPLSIYIHIPFCHALCYYCGCSKIVTRNRERADQYLTALVREISLQGELFSHDRTVRQLHLGGGTPTYFDHGQMSRLLEALNTQVGAAEAPAANLNSLLVSLDASRDTIKGDLDVVHEYASECDVFLENVDVSSKEIAIGGSAATEEEILKYYGRLLYDSGRFSTVIISNITVTEDGVNFSMELSG